VRNAPGHQSSEGRTAAAPGRDEIRIDIVGDGGDPLGDLDDVQVALLLPGKVDCASESAIAVLVAAGSAYFRMSGLGSMKSRRTATRS
jgi:hypothetical protein